MAAHHLIIGGQRSGKSRHAERLALAWRAAQPGREVVVLATAQASDEEMRQRIARHQQDRPAGFLTVEEPLRLGDALARVARPDRLVVVDCLTLWLTNVLMPPPLTQHGEAALHGGVAPGVHSALAGPDTALLDELPRFLEALAACASPVIMVSNEIGNGVIPLGAQVRDFVDELGRLNQAVAQRCERMSWMVAGQPFTQAVERWA